MAWPTGSDTEGKRRTRRRWCRAAGLVLAAALLGHGAPAAADTPPLPTFAVGAEPLEPLPVAVPVDEGLARLGRHLYFEPRLSGDGSLSCASCHDLASGGDDGRELARGLNGSVRPFNAPGLYNLAFHYRYGWTGNYRSLADQAGHAVEDEMGGHWPDALAALADDPVIVALAPEGLTRQRAEAALAAYLESLVTPDSRFDQWLQGDSAALTADERRGYALFKSYGCASCHQGKAVGGTMVQRIGLFHPFFPRAGSQPQSDLGRFAVTSREQDRHAFKVPSLRNVAETAPYLHDGSVQTLEGVVRLMAYYQVGRSLSDRDVADITAFLKSLSGRLPGTARPPVREPPS